MIKKAAVILSVLILLTMMPGCSVPSAPLDFDQPEAEATISDASVAFREAADFTRAEGRKFWFSGWVVTRIADQKTTSMYDGIAMSEQLLVNAKVFGLPYHYYRNGKDTLLYQDGRWQHTDKASAPQNPLGNLDLLADLVRGLPANRLNDEIIVGQPTTVLEFQVPAANLEEALSSLGFSAEDLKNARIDQAGMKLTVWIGEKQPFLYQYESLVTLPVPGAGALEQEVFFRFWDYNNERIQPQEFERIEQQLGG
jgi:hypothetical protein